MKRFKAIVEGGLLLGIIYLIYEIIYYIYTYIIYQGILKQWSFIITEPYSHLQSPEDVTMNFVLDHPLEYTLLCWIVIIIIFILIALLAKINPKSLLSIERLSFKNMLACIVLGIGLVFIINGLIRFTGEVSDFKFSYMDHSTFKVYDLWYLLLIVGVITPIFEELFFRGIILSRLKEGYGPVMSVILSSILFSVSHLNIVQSVYVFPLGILAGVLVIKTGSIFASIWVHMFYNILNIYLAKINFFQYNSVQLLVMISLGIALLIFGLQQLDDKILEQNP